MEIQERTENLVSLTPAAAAKIRDLMASEEDVSVLRVAIEGGGCSGFQYGLGFDRGAQEGDHEFECEGVTVVVDPFSAPYLMGAQVDYLETIQEPAARPPTARTIVSSAVARPSASLPGSRTKIAVPCGASTSSPSMVNLAPPCTTTYSSSWRSPPGPAS